MPSIFTEGLNLEKPATGEQSNNWGTTLNANFDLIDKALTGQLSKSVAGAGDVTLTEAEALNAFHVYSGTITADINVVVPDENKVYLVHNSTSGAFTLTVKTAAGTGITVDQGTKALLYCDAANVLDIFSEDRYLENLVEDLTPQLGGALDTNGFAINDSQGSDVTAAAETNIWAEDGNTVRLTGTATATITSFGTSPRVGARRKIIAGSPAVVAHDGTLITVPGAANKTLTAGDAFSVYADGTTEHRVESFLGNDGNSIRSIVSGSDIVIGSDAEGDILYYNGTNYVRLPKGTAGQHLKLNDAADAPAWGPGLVQEVYAEDATYASTTSEIPADNTIPQNTEGAQAVTVAITPTNASNILYIEAGGSFNDGSSNEMVVLALFQDSTANALKATGGGGGQTSQLGGSYINHRMVAGTTSATTFKLRFGSPVGNSTSAYRNGSSSARLYGGVAVSWIRVTEIAV